MAKKKNTDDSLGMVVAKGLAILAIDKRLRLDEANAVNEAFAEIVRAVQASRDHAQRIKTLEADIKRLKGETKPQLKAVAS